MYVCTEEAMRIKALKNDDVEDFLWIFPCNFWVETAEFHLFLLTNASWCLQLPENVNISKEARTAIGKAASVFVLYATSWYVLVFGFCSSPILHDYTSLFCKHLHSKSCTSVLVSYVLVNNTEFGVVDEHKIMKWGQESYFLTIQLNICFSSVSQYFVKECSFFHIAKRL